MKHRTPHDQRTTTLSKEIPQPPKNPHTPNPLTNPNSNPTPWAGGAVNKLDVEFTTPPATKLERHQSPPGALAHEDPK